MKTSKFVTNEILDLYSTEDVIKGMKYAACVGYETIEEFYSLVISRILYSDDQLAAGEKYIVE